MVEYGALESLPYVANEAAPKGLTWNSTEATPEVASEAETVTAVAPVTEVPADGALTEPDGAVLSTVLVGSVEVVRLPALSVRIARRS